MLEGANELFGTLQSFCNGEYGMIIPLTVKGNGEVMFIREKVEGKYVQVGINIFDECIFQYIEKVKLEHDDIVEPCGNYDSIISYEDCNDDFFMGMDDWIDTLFGGGYSSFWIASHSLRDIVQILKEEY